MQCPPNGLPLPRLARKWNTPSVALLFVCITRSKAHPQGTPGLPPPDERTFRTVPPHPLPPYPERSLHRYWIPLQDYFQRQQMLPHTFHISLHEAHQLAHFYRAIHLNPLDPHHQTSLMSQPISTGARVRGRRRQDTVAVQSGLYLPLPCFRDHKQPVTLLVIWRKLQRFRFRKEAMKTTFLAHKVETTDQASSPMSPFSPNQPPQKTFTPRKKMRTITGLRRRGDKNEDAVLDRHRWRRKKFG